MLLRPVDLPLRARIKGLTAARRPVSGMLFPGDVIQDNITQTRKVCKILAFMAIIMGLGLLFYIWGLGKVYKDVNKAG